MSNFVSFKGRGDGILALLSADASFEAVLSDLKDKITAKEEFFKSGDIRLSFGGRDLSELEKALLIHSMHGIVGDKTKIVFEAAGESLSTGFYRGIVRGGQRIKSSGSLVILGDVNPGGEVTAAENIVVLGALRGIAHAGYPSDKNAVVAALSMQPKQIRIADVYSMAPSDGLAAGEMELAYINEGKIFIEKIQELSSMR